MENHKWRNTLVGFLGLATQIIPTYAQSLDPILNFCTRWQHASVVKGGKLYIDGGAQTFRPDGSNYTTARNITSYLGVNEWILTTNMNETWNWWTNITQDKIRKEENPSTGAQPANGTVRAAMFQGPPDQDRVYTFGGSSFLGNESFKGWFTIQNSVTPLWSVEFSDMQWTQHPSAVTLQPNFGLAAEAVDQSLAFYLNGQIDEGTSQLLRGMGNDTLNIPGMVVINTSNQTMVNITTPGLPSDTYPRAGGNMEYFPALGERGVLLAMGGAYGNFPTQGNFASQKLATFETVDIFDIASYLKNVSSHGKWYSQNTTGEIPPARIDTCIVMKSAPDNSSHNIYMYGGRDPTLSPAVMYDDIYALSIPSFTWVKVYSSEAYRWGHTCHNVGNRQMLTVGGSDSLTGLVQCDWEVRSVAIYDLSTGIWGTVFVDNDPLYNVSQPIVDVIGGSGDGNATRTQPPGGWNTPALAQVLFPTTKPTKKVSAGTISGAVVGSIAGLALIVTLALWQRRRRMAAAKKKANRKPVVEAPDTEKAEIEGDLKMPTEAPGKEIPFEMESPNKDMPYEMDGTSKILPAELEGNVEYNSAELSGEAVPPGGRLGIPMITTTTHQDRDVIRVDEIPEPVDDKLTHYAEVEEPEKVDPEKVELKEEEKPKKEEKAAYETDKKDIK